MRQGKQFSSTYQPKNRGRKKLLITLCKENGLSAQNIKNSILNVLTMSRDELLNIGKDPNNPVVYSVLAKALNDGRTCFNAQMELLKFVFGSKIDITTNGNDLTPQTINVMFNGEVKENLNE